MEELFDPAVVPASTHEATPTDSVPPRDETTSDSSPSDGYTEEEDAAIQQRLADLGYL